MVATFAILHKTYNVYSKRMLSRITMDSGAVKVAVREGVIVGERSRLPSGLLFDSFKGVPYAVPPLGKLRFKSPVPLERFDVPELDCRKERDVSHQKDPFTLNVVGSENCLFLNVYVPRDKINDQPLPVMVWIHGGGFWFGNGNSDYCFPQMLLENNVIVVTLNYRLGALGFLYLPEEGIYGNAGLKDQRLALQWVQDNISEFNGDPNNVTIFGESAGGASVHLHTYANHANKLFHKAILQSGTANMEWVFQANPAVKTKRLAERLGYKSDLDNTSQLLEFLQSSKVTPLGILSNTIPVLTADEKRRGLPLTFKPVVEDSTSPDSFIEKDIMELLHTRDRLQGLPLIMGYNSGEGMGMLINANRKLEQYDQDLARLVPRNLVSNPADPAAKEVAAQIREFYFKGKRLSDTQLNSLVDLLSDYHFNIDMQQAAKIHAHQQPKSPLFFYRFDYVGGRNIYKRMFQFDDLKGACHGDELFYLFQMAGDKSPVATEDALMSNRICRMWTNFARFGNPSTDDCIWNPVRSIQSSEMFNLEYLTIDRDCKMSCNPDADRIAFWQNMYKTYRPDYTTQQKAKL